MDLLPVRPPSHPDHFLHFPARPDQCRRSRRGRRRYHFMLHFLFLEVRILRWDRC